MSTLKESMNAIQSLVVDAYISAGELIAAETQADTDAVRKQKLLEQTADQYERAALEVRRICESHATGVGGYGRKPELPPVRAEGFAERTGQGWLHIQINTLLPHCRFYAPTWLTSTITRLLNEYEGGAGGLPYFDRAMLVIDEHSKVGSRHIFDQDNKGWKAVSNAIKGRLIPDDDQYTLSLALRSTKSDGDVCHIFLMDVADAALYFSLYPGGYTC